MNYVYSEIKCKKIRNLMVDIVWGNRKDRISASYQKRLSIIKSLVYERADSYTLGADLSGGGGRWLEDLSDGFNEFIHFDLNKKAIDSAKVDHPNLGHVNYIQNDLLAPSKTYPNIDVAFCIDTLLYGKSFIEDALLGATSILGPRSLLICEFSSKLHGKVGDLLFPNRGPRPERRVTFNEAIRLCWGAGLEPCAKRILFKEMPSITNQILSRMTWTPVVRDCSTWFYVALRKK